jgi:hypothetical protein
MKRVSLFEEVLQTHLVMLPCENRLILPPEKGPVDISLRHKA